MRILHLWLKDFRNYESVEFHPAPDGLTVIAGANAEGKTNLLEAVGYLALSGSFRGAPSDAMVRNTTERAIVRSEAEREDRQLLIEAEIPASGRTRMLINRQPLRRNRDLRDGLMVSVFSPDDLVLLKGTPGERRRYIDNTLAFVDVQNAALQSDFERVVNQRNALLRQSGGSLSPDIISTLNVWDWKMAELGNLLSLKRATFVNALEPEVGKAYNQIAQSGATIALNYQRSWTGELHEALLSARHNDVRKGVTSVGPHRDELIISIDGLPARTQASQGEQRSLALALRLSAHRFLTESHGVTPILLLDDVFSELDPARSEALMENLPSGQSFLTTAGPLPPGASPKCVVRISNGDLLT